tara:strand:- start:7089 stop:9236 length:2148 start_codon:yes stop_codon:yes gene_type:complete
MSVGIIRYPGSNCDFDTLRYFDDSFFIWHTETAFPENIKLLIIPGGFAFGDRLYDKASMEYIISPGTMAVQSPVSSIIKEAVKRKIPILGICNGFQILIQMGLLPGKLILNKNKKFTCKKVECSINYEINSYYKVYNTELYIANSYGQYVIDENEYGNLISNKQIFLTYNKKIDEVGSSYNIGGISNKDKTIFGMMPHPERNNKDFKSILYQILTPKDKCVNNQVIFHNKVIELMHSEHISYKSTRKYLKNLHTKAPWVIQGPGENAGIIDIGDGYCITARIESHNHPTYIDPFEGAATGVGGILRDIFTMGSRPIAILDFLRFGTDKHSEELLKTAISGISYYGNCIGVPNVGGDCYLHPCYNKNPLVNVGCIGIVKKENIIYGRASDINQKLIYVGSRTGNEGIGGAAMASKSFNSKININELKENVQKADPFLEKLLLDACCEITENKLVIGMQDMGAGGLLCASHEIIMRGRDKFKLNLGCNIFLDKVPIKSDMEPCDILVSESQERMLIVASEDNIIKIFEIFDKWDLEYSIVGETTDNGIYSVLNNEEILYSEKMLNFKDIYQDWNLEENNTNIDHKKIEKIKNMELWKVYDSTVGNRTIKGPDQPGSYSIIDIYENNSKLILTWGEDFNECYRKMLELNAQPKCIVNCLNFGDPKYCMKDLVNTIEELNTNCKNYKIPIIGGNVSLYNSTDCKSIRTTLILIMIGVKY